MPVFKDHSFRFGASGAGDTPVYEINQSIRFNDDDSAYLKKDYGSDGSQTTFTLSGWFKLGINAGTAHCLFATGFINGSAADFTLFFAGNQLKLYAGYNGGTPANKLITTQLFRDHSAWYHIVFVADTTNAVSSNRLKLYVNGERVVRFDTETYPSQNDTLVWGDATYSHVIGASGDDSAGSLNSQTPRYYFDGYMAELYYLDGYAYGPEYFGTTDSSGIWIPINYDTTTGNYGTNGFKIDGSDSATLGKNVATGNTFASFTSSGLAAHDQMIDTPNNIFCTMSPINKHANVTLSDGNLHALNSGTSIAYPSAATMLIPETGKWYAEIRIINRIQPHEYPTTGIFNNAAKRLITNSNNPGNTSGDKDIGFGADERRYENGTNTDPWGNGMDDGNVAAIAVDMDNKKIFWGHNQTGSFVWQVSGNPNTGANPANTIEFEIRDMLFGNGHYSNSEVHWNFGQDGTFGGALTAGGNTDANGIGNFYYPVPTSYLALCTRNVFTG